MEGSGEEKAFTATVTSQGKYLQLYCSGQEQQEFHAVWLRHHCKCSQCSTETSYNQKLSLPHELDPTTSIAAAEVSGSRVNVEWSCGHKGFFSIKWLTNALVKPKKTKRIVATSLPKITAEEVLGSDEGLWRWLKNINDYGICLITGLPIEKGTIYKIADTLNGPMNTPFGRDFEVLNKVDPDHELVLYSSRGLSFHTDMAYNERPGGVQLFYCHRNDACVEGGVSTLLDSHPILEELKIKHPQHYASLTRIPATFKEYGDNSGGYPVDVCTQEPHIVLDEDGEQVKRFRWSPLQEGVLNVPKEDVLPYYEAYSCLARMMEDSPHKVYHRLNPGEMITLNNWRMLHGRTEMKDNGGRRMELAFIDMDGYMSRLKLLTKKLNKDI